MVPYLGVRSWPAPDLIQFGDISCNSALPASQSQKLDTFRLDYYTLHKPTSAHHDLAKDITLISHRPRLLHLNHPQFMFTRSV